MSDVYLDAARLVGLARAIFTVGPESIDEAREAVAVRRAADEDFRSIVDAARAPLLARIAELEAERDRYRSSLPVEAQDYWYWRTRAEQAEARSAP